MKVDEWGAPVELASGVRCGAHGRGTPIYHESAAAVKLCYAVAREMEAQSRAEAEAELRNERWFEDRGWEEARAQEDYEARMGMVDFGTAYREACPELFVDEA